MFFVEYFLKRLYLSVLYMVIICMANEQGSGRGQKLCCLPSVEIRQIFSDFDIFQENVTTLFPVIQIKVDSAESIVSK